MKMSLRKAIRGMVVGCFWATAAAAAGQTLFDGERFRYTSAFPDVTVTQDIVYGANVNAMGASQDLVVDVYEPAGDAADGRPLLIIAHGGFFVGGSNDGADVVPLCEDFARMGYVVASMSYRLGIDNFFDLENAMTRAVWRGVHDSRAAVRFFRKSIAEEGNPFRIDADRIVLGGVSAGGFIALHHAYVDEASEIPSAVDPNGAGLGGGLEGNSGNPGYSSDVMGIFNIAGALKTADYLAPGDEPLVSVHGDADATVPFGAGTVYLTMIPVTDVEGSGVVHETAVELGVDACLEVLEGADHVPHVSSAAHYDTTLAVVAGRISTWLCDDFADVCGMYDVSSDIASVVAPAVWAPVPNPVVRGGWLGLPASRNGFEVFSAQGSLVRRIAGGLPGVSTADWDTGIYVIVASDSGKAARAVILD
ncbi:MAG: alpha/beta hydrolase [Flavobacteriales bacterium]